MKTNYLNVIFTLAWLITTGCAWGDSGRSYELRFIDSETLRPIISQKFLLIPRKIEVLKYGGPESPDPNLKFAKSIRTNSEGNLTLSEKLIVTLTEEGKLYVDSSSDLYTSFCLRAEFFPKGEPNFTITTFHKGLSGRVAGMIYLSEQHVNTLLLESKDDTR